MSVPPARVRVLEAEQKENTDGGGFAETGVDGAVELVEAVGVAMAARGS